MIPKSLIDADTQIVVETQPTKTYRLSEDSIQGFTDELEALQQAIYKVLHTEKYEYPIYGFDYGIDLESLLGKDPVYAQIEAKRRIQECLLQDARIKSVDNFQFTIVGDEMNCTFDVVSIYGKTTIAREVMI
jgi:hypothetical protein